MKILFLSPHKHLIPFLESFNDEIIQTIEPLTDEIIENVDFIISYGYRHIIKKDIINKFPDKIINLHMSYLPWNRGADPNLWSFLENTPKGVTIHFMDEGIDTGNIIIQKEIKYNFEVDTLKSTYEKLSKTIEELFKYNWEYIKKNVLISMPQLIVYYESTFHNSKDKEKFEYLLTAGWDTKIKDIIGKGAKE